MKMKIHHHRVLIRVSDEYGRMDIFHHFLFLANPRQRNSNSQGRTRDSSNKKDSKKLSKSTSDNDDDDEGYSILNRTSGLPDYDGVVYTLDAKLIGNIGRYFNHSCSPNIAVQNVFVDVSL